MHINSDNQALIKSTRAISMCKCLIIKDFPPPPKSLSHNKLRIHLTAFPCAGNGVEFTYCLAADFCRNINTIFLYGTGMSKLRTSLFYYSFAVRRKEGEYILTAQKEKNKQT